MKAYDLMEAVGEINSDFIADAQRYREKRPARRCSLWKMLPIAATLALMLMGCAIVYSLKDLKVGEMQEQIPGQPERTLTFLSLQGFTNSPGCKAAEEWREFRKSYDPDGKLHEYGIYHGFRAPEAYDAYGCSTQDKVDKVDEICKKYKLKPHGKTWRILDASKVFEASGIHGIQNGGTEAEFDIQYGGCYADGSFSFRGGVTFPGQKIGDMLNYDVNRKDAFDVSSDAVADVEAYDDWHYTTKDGVELLLATCTDESLIFADLDDYFIRVRLIANDQLPADAAGRRRVLEEKAEFFDFQIQPGHMNTSIMDEAEQDYENMMNDMEAEYQQGFRCADYKTFMENSPFHQDWEYALADLNSDGFDELILTLENGTMQEILTDNGTETSLAMSARNLTSVPYVDGSNFWLAQDGTLVEHVVCGDCQRYSFFRLEKVAYQLFDFVEYHAEAPAHWARGVDKKTEISEDEAKKVINAYQPMKLDFKPVSEFSVE